MESSPRKVDLWRMDCSSPSVHLDDEASPACMHVAQPERKQGGEMGGQFIYYWTFGVDAETAWKCAPRLTSGLPDLWGPVQGPGKRTRAAPHLKPSSLVSLTEPHQHRRACPRGLHLLRALVACWAASEALAGTPKHEHTVRDASVPRLGRLCRAMSARGCAVCESPSVVGPP